MNDQPLGHPDSPYLTLAEAASFCRFDTCKNPVKAFRQWAERKRIPRATGRRGPLFERRVLKDFLERKQWTSRTPRSVQRRSA